MDFQMLVFRKPSCDSRESISQTLLIYVRKNRHRVHVLLGAVVDEVPEDGAPVGHREDVREEPRGDQQGAEAGVCEEGHELRGWKTCETS